MKILIKRLSEDAFIPKKATTGSAAYDLFVPRNMVIPTGRSVIPLDFALDMPLRYRADIWGRSGYDAKGFAGYDLETEEEKRYDCDVKHGLIDCDYRDGVGVIVHNHDVPFKVIRGQRIAQMEIAKGNHTKFIETLELTDSSRKGGFGHTGI